MRIRVFINKLKWSWQRLKRGYSDYDVDEFNTWFQSVIPPMLLALRKQYEKPMAGYPSVMSKDFFEEHRAEIGLSYDEYQASQFTPLWKQWDERMYADCSRRWISLIEEMRYLFLESNEDTCSKKICSCPNERPETLRKPEDELAAYRKECRRKAFALFCEWFDYLWY